MVLLPSSLEQDHDPAPAEASPEPGEKPPGLPPHNVAFKEMLRRFQGQSGRGRSWGGACGVAEESQRRVNVTVGNHGSGGTTGANCQELQADLQQEAVGSPAGSLLSQEVWRVQLGTTRPRGGTGDNPTLRWGWRQPDLVVAPVVTPVPSLSPQ